jgi:hypothetical protein
VEELSIGGLSRESKRKEKRAFKIIDKLLPASSAILI